MALVPWSQGTTGFSRIVLDSGGNLEEESSSDIGAVLNMSFCKAVNDEYIYFKYKLCQMSIVGKRTL